MQPEGPYETGMGSNKLFQNASLLMCFCASYYLGKLEIISDSIIFYNISKGRKYRLPSQIDFNKCREEIAVSLNEFCKRWCRKENFECNGLNNYMEV